MSEQYRRTCEAPSGRGEVLSAKLDISGLHASLTVVYQVGDMARTVIYQFGLISAIKLVTEFNSRSFLQDSHKYLCEIVRSTWVDELRRNEPPRRQVLKMKHFALMIESFGYLELVCDNFTIKDEINNLENI